MTPTEHGLVAVVDDDASTLSALWRLLVAHHFHVKTFASAEELLHSAALEQAVCVVADIHLGDGMSGLQLGETILAGQRAIPLVFMTGRADVDVRRRALELGCVAFLEKPFAPSALVEALSKALGLQL